MRRGGAVQQFRWAGSYTCRCLGGKSSAMVCVQDVVQTSQRLHLYLRRVATHPMA